MVTTVFDWIVHSSTSKIKILTAIKKKIDRKSKPQRTIQHTIT